jgi:hypothetical protein
VTCSARKAALLTNKRDLGKLGKLGKHECISSCKACIGEGALHDEELGDYSPLC